VTILNKFDIVPDGQLTVNALKFILLSNKGQRNLAKRRHCRAHNVLCNTCSRTEIRDQCALAVVTCVRHRRDSWSFL